MSYTYRWYDEGKTILLFDVAGQWTWDEAYAAIRDQQQMMDTVDHGVHTIFRMGDLPVLPKGNALYHLRRLMTTVHRNERMAVFVGSHALLQAFIKTASKIYGLRNLVARYRFVATLDEALAQIAKYEGEKV